MLLGKPSGRTAAELELAEALLVFIVTLRVNIHTSKTGLQSHKLSCDNLRVKGRIFAETVAEVRDNAQKAIPRAGFA